MSGAFRMPVSQATGSTAVPHVADWGSSATVREILDAIFEDVDPDVPLALEALAEPGGEDWESVKRRLGL